mmetsp:Transcript_27520/g.44774  ORF Transcript_27520/g.44774 Transcript_27520/m.44774 type:complete len:273 (+) Transcript_27520:169-987(+)
MGGEGKDTKLLRIDLPLEILRGITIKYENLEKFIQKEFGDTDAVEIDKMMEQIYKLTNNVFELPKYEVEKFRKAIRAGRPREKTPAKVYQANEIILENFLEWLKDYQKSTNRRKPDEGQYLFHIKVGSASRQQGTIEYPVFSKLPKEPTASGMDTVDGLQAKIHAVLRNDLLKLTPEGEKDVTREIKVFFSNKDEKGKIDAKILHDYLSDPKLCGKPFKCKIIPFTTSHELELKRDISNMVNDTYFSCTSMMLMTTQKREKGDIRKHRFKSL